MNILLRCFSILVFSLLFQQAFSQVTIDEVSKKQKKKFEKAQQLDVRMQTDEKQKALLKILEGEPDFVDALMEMSLVYYQKQEFEKSLELADKAINLSPDYNPKYYLIKANICKSLIDFDCEESMLKKYLTYNVSSRNRKKADGRLGRMKEKKMIAKNYEGVELEKLGEGVNSSSYAEYKPVLSLDDSTIVFTRRVGGQEDFYQSQFSNNVWEEAVPINELNTPGNEGSHAISPDGIYMIYTRCDAPKRYRSCDLYISKKKDGKWLNGKFLAVTNTEAWESQASFSPDGKTIYYSSSKPGGMGGRDIYTITREKGKWGQPQNLGETINTKKNDESPFLHPDGRTLYFMSNGHVGLGGQDLFVTHMNFDGTWTEPVNMGPSINTEKDEGGLFVDLAGKYAYFSQTALSAEGLQSDIFRFELPQKFKPQPVSYVSFNVYDKQTNEPIEAELNMTEMGSGQSKKFRIQKEGLIEIISQKSQYELFVEKEGYVFYSEHIDFEVRNNKEAPIEYNIGLEPIRVDVKKDTTEAISLRNIYFNSNESTLLASSFAEVDRLVSLLKKEELADVLLNGHTDNVGNAEDNVILSRERANAVKEYLIEKGISGKRISIQALGESQALTSNDTEEGRANNRRIEFQLIYR